MSAATGGRPPDPELYDDGIEPSPFGLPIMSLLDYFAGQALASSNLESEKSDEDIARRCYDRAAAMLAVRGDVVP